MDIVNKSEDLLHSENGTLHGSDLPSSENGYLQPNNLPAAEKDAVLASGQETDWAADARNPHNWIQWKRRYHTATAAFYAFTATYMSSAYASGATQAGEELGVSTTVSILGVTLYCVGLALGPIVGAPLSESHGRLIIYRFGVPIAALFLLGCAVSKNIASVVICRFFAGVFASPSLSVGGGTMADVWKPSERGRASTLFLFACFLGPCMAPVIGGFVVEHKGWKWLEWVAVFWAIATSLFAIGMQETYKKTILERDAKKQDKSLSFTLPKLHWASVQQWLSVALIRPLKMLFTEPILLFLSVYTGFNFAVLYAFFASLPFVFATTYGFDDHEVGLVFIALAIGALLGMLTGFLCDRYIYQKRSKAAVAKGEPAHLPAEQRLHPAMLGSVGCVVSLFWFAWTARPDIHWISPVLALIPFNWANLSIFISAANYLIDCYGSRFGASALSANALLRYIFAGAFPLFTIQMYERLTTKWATSLIAFIALALVPIPWVLYIFGPKIRQHNRYR